MSIESNSQQSISPVRKYLLIGAGFGAGLVLAGALVAGGLTWWTSRPQPVKPWDAKAITCQFAELNLRARVVDGKKASNFRYDFEFTCTNTTDEDLRMEGSDDRVLLTPFFSDGSIGSPPDSGVGNLTLSRSVFIPARGKQRLSVEYKLPEDLEEGTDFFKRIAGTPMVYLERGNPGFAGFSAHVPDRRIQILLRVPKDAELSKRYPVAAGGRKKD